MARPIKKGLDYFPCDVNIFNDRKVKRLIKNFGCKGLSVYLCLLCEAYSDEGYFVKYNGDILIDVASQFEGVTTNLVDEIIKACLAYELFHNGLFAEHKILTSSGIQERYKSAKRGGKINELLQVNLHQRGVIAAITHQIDTLIPKNDTLSTQSKVKESKVKESKENHAPQTIEVLKVDFDKSPPVAAAPQNLQGSNLFRQPKVPTIQRVQEVFRANGGTEEMANKFFAKHDAVGWYFNNSPITKFENFVSGFITTFLEIQKKQNGSANNQTIGGRNNGIQRTRAEALRNF